MKYLIVSNGILTGDEPLLTLISEADAVICADGGLKHLKRVHVIPDVLIGDMDSIGDDFERYFTYKSKSNHHFYNSCYTEKTNQNFIKPLLIKYPAKKDATDTELAVSWAVENGATYITLTGVTGTRMDHTISNIFLLKQIAKQGIGCKIVDNYNEIYLISLEEKRKNQITYTISVNGKKGDLLSIIPVTEDVKGLTLEGLEYPLNSASLKFGTSNGISNVFVQEIAYISLQYGTILVIKSSD